MIIKDWIDAVVDEIERSPSEPDFNGDYSLGYIRRVILRHSPFKDGVAYMPVPRCETCAHFHVDTGPLILEGACHLEIDVTGSKMRAEGYDSLVRVTEDFGCVQWKEKA